jgi:hypothetical protein
MVGFKRVRATSPRSLRFLRRCVDQAQALLLGKGVGEEANRGGIESRIEWNRPS